MLRSILIIIVFSFCACSKESEPAKITTFNEGWYEVTEVNSSTWIFQETRSSQGNVNYLIAGSERAIMFDAGSGENFGQDGTKLRYKIEETTNRPTTLLLSHFHFDHNQNIAEFENVGFPDLDFLRQSVDEDNIYHFSEGDLFVGTTPTSVKVTEWFPLEADIDLGERVIQLINLPGHTDESVIIIDHNNKMAFLGDVLYNGAVYVFDASDMEIYAQSLERLQTLVDQDYALFGAHSTPQVSHKHLTSVLRLFDCVLNGNCYTESSEMVFGKRATIYSALDRTAAILLIHLD